MLYGYLPSGSINECVSPPNVNWKVARRLWGDVNATSASGQERAVVAESKRKIGEHFSYHGNVQTKFWVELQ